MFLEAMRYGALFMPPRTCSDMHFTPLLPSCFLSYSSDLSMVLCHLGHVQICILCSSPSIFFFFFLSFSSNLSMVSRLVPCVVGLVDYVFLDQ